LGGRAGRAGFRLPLDGGGGLKPLRI